MVERERSAEADAWLVEDQKALAKPGTLGRWVAVDQATRRMVGYASLWHVRLWKYRMDLMIHPGWRKRGVGGSLFDVLLENLRLARAGTAQARAGEDATESLAFLQRRGFGETNRMRELRLELREADFSPFAEVAGRLAAEDIGLTTLEREEAEDAAAWSKITDLQNAVVPTWPDPDPGGPARVWTVDECQNFITIPGYIREALFVAKAGDQYIGYSVLGADTSEPEGIGSGPTAVRPEYRGRGIATMLKVQCLTYAQRRGFVVAVSRSANPAMIRVNEKLGFQLGTAVVRLVKRLNPQPEET